MLILTDLYIEETEGSEWHSYVSLPHVAALWCDSTAADSWVQLNY